MKRTTIVAAIFAMLFGLMSLNSSIALAKGSKSKKPKTTHVTKTKKPKTKKPKTKTTKHTPGVARRSSGATTK
jgi:hypothetical protein